MFKQEARTNGNGMMREDRSLQVADVSLMLLEGGEPLHVIQRLPSGAQNTHTVDVAAIGVCTKVERGELG